MKPLFTIHAGEYLVGALIDQRFKRLNVWIPLRDTAIDLLVSDRRNSRSISLQVKFSKDFLVTHMGRAFQKQLHACGWWTINGDKLHASPADYWVFVVQGFASRTVDFVVMPRSELWQRLREIHGPAKRIQSYIWITEGKRCWEPRGLNRRDQLLIAHGDYESAHRDLTPWLNNWVPLTELNR